ncbi:MAG: malto-oligosyltrehalose synthase, partial [Bacteroidetes bacterium]|nr:malto-oligosyltrehalose synthase [Fibrella sp.]
LQQIADEQVYALCSHDETDHQINYRRFFTVNSLICLNVQEPAVFDHVHERINAWLRAGVFQGVRVDHIDGLYDPTRYLQQLRQRAGDEAYIVVEKILQMNEELPSTWPIQGETGYSYLSMVNNLFTQTRSGPGFTRFYHDLLGEKMSVRAELYDKKSYILREHMGGELDNLHRLFLDLNLTDGETLSVLPPETLKAGIGEFLVQCPVYRYYGNHLPLSDDEAAAVRAILDRIRREKPDLIPAADLLETVLLVTPQADDEDYNSRALWFYQRCMQFTGPLMAKGFEDTLMYTYARFIGHDEVGDSPAFFGLTPGTFHQKMMERQANWPLALNATSTHDTKRGEDVRSRLNVLTDLTDEWIEEVEAWQVLNQAGRLTTGGEAPDANDEYFIYQTLTGAYPMPGRDEDDFPNRLAEYLQKALREAKRHSTWNNPDETYEAATQRFAARLLDQQRPFWARFQAFHRQVADFGIVNSLAQVVLKCTCPGLPDVYQGCEGWDLSLVDPDNRRSVDFGQREQWLDELIARDQAPADLWLDLWQHRYDARLKLWLTHVLLNERSRQADLFAEGDYVPLTVEGRHQRHVFAFARRHQERWYVVAVPLGMARLCREQQADVSAPDWADTRIMLPAEAPNTWEHRLLTTTGSAGEGIAVGDIFAPIPLAVLQLG